MQAPKTLNYVDSLNYFIYSTEQKILEEKRLQEEKRLRELEYQEKLKREASARANARAMKERLAEERMKREQAKNARLAALRAAKKVDKKETCRPRKKISEMTAGIGRTHVSKCHHSREDFDMSIRLIPAAGNPNNSMHVTIETLNTPMIMERVVCTPFLDNDTPITEPNDIQSSKLITEEQIEVSERVTISRQVEFAKSVNSPLRPETIASLRTDTADNYNTRINSSAWMQESFDALLRPNSLPKPIEASNVRYSRSRPPLKSYSFNRQTFASATLIREEEPPAVYFEEPLKNVTILPETVRLNPSSLLYEADISYKRWELTTYSSKKKTNGARKPDTILTNTKEEMDYIQASDKPPAILSRSFFLPHLTRINRENQRDYYHNDFHHH